MKREFFKICAVFGLLFLSSSIVVGQQNKLLFSFSEAPQAIADKEGNSPASVREARVDFNLDANLISQETKLLIPLF